MYWLSQFLGGENLLRQPTDIVVVIQWNGSGVFGSIGKIELTCGRSKGSTIVIKVQYRSSKKTMFSLKHSTFELISIIIFNC